MNDTAQKPRRRWGRWLIPAGLAAGLAYFVAGRDEQSPPQMPDPYTHMDISVDRSGRLYLVPQHDPRDKIHPSMDACVTGNNGNAAECQVLTTIQRQYTGAAGIAAKERVCAAVSAHGTWPSIGILFSKGANAQAAIDAMTAVCADNGHCTGTTATASCNFQNTTQTGTFTLTP